MAEALTRLPALTRSGVYWAGRLTCCSRAEDIPVYDRVFEAWFVTGPGDERSRTRVEVDRPVGEVDDDAAGEESGDDDPGLVTATASTREVLRHRDVARLTRRSAPRSTASSPRSASTGRTAARGARLPAAPASSTGGPPPPPCCGPAASRPGCGTAGGR